MLLPLAKENPICRIHSIARGPLHTTAAAILAVIKRTVGKTTTQPNTTFAAGDRDPRDASGFRTAELPQRPTVPLPVFGIRLRNARQHIDHSTHRVTPVQGRAGPSNDFYLVNHKWINQSEILIRCRPEKRRIEPHAIDQHERGTPKQAPDDRRGLAWCRLLDKHSGLPAQQVRQHRRRVSLQRVASDDRHRARDIKAGSLFSRSGDGHFRQGDCVAEFTSRRVSRLLRLDLGIGEYSDSKE